MAVRLQRRPRREPLAPLDGLEFAWLRSVFEHALRGSLLGSLALAGCAGGDAGEHQGGDGGAVMSSTLRCISTQWELAERFALDRDVDYVADRENGTVLSDAGERCRSAQDQAACLSAVALAEQSFGGRELLTTEGDVVRLWQNPGVVTLFGEIDSAQEALWLVATNNYRTPCAETYVTEAADGFQVHDALRGDETCSHEDRARVTVLVKSDASFAELSVVKLPGMGCAIEGRRPEGLCSTHRARTGSLLGEHFAAMAHMEAASVPAFATIGRELAQHGAPTALRAGAERARRDEVRHARVAARLARSFGALATAPRVERRPLRGLLAFALDNAVEGCVHETYAALETSHQAVHARDRVIARALAGIAKDETRHAALSWQIHAWVMPKLAAHDRRRVLAAQRVAAEQLADRAAVQPEPLLCERAGLPDATTARALHASLARDLWRV